MQTKPKHTEKYTTIRIKTTTREELKKQVMPTLTLSDCKRIEILLAERNYAIQNKQ
jgi:hypothetical protein